MEVVTAAAQASEPGEIVSPGQAPVVGATGAVVPAVVEPAAVEPSAGKVLRLKGGAPPDVLLPARKIAKSRRASCVTQKKAASRLAKFAAVLPVVVPPVVPISGQPDGSSPDSSEPDADVGLDKEQATGPGRVLVQTLRPWRPG